MNPYVIVTDSCADMVPGFAAENHIVELELTYTIGGVTRPCNDPSLSRPAFYDMVRAGEMPITAQVNIEDAVRALTPLLDAGSDLLCIMFSSALSGTYNSVRLAAEELAPQYPTQRIIVLDSLAASAGQGMLVARAVMYRERGLSLDESAERIKEDIPRQAHLFTVDDLNHLHRGGRVSKTAAVFGTMLGIKPLLHVDDGGWWRAWRARWTRRNATGSPSATETASTTPSSWPTRCAGGSGSRTIRSAMSARSSAPTRAPGRSRSSSTPSTSKIQS